MAITCSISAGVIERNEAALPDAKKPQDASLPCGSGLFNERLRADLFLLITGSPRSA